MGGDSSVNEAQQKRFDEMTMEAAFRHAYQEEEGQPITMTARQLRIVLEYDGGPRPKLRLLKSTESERDEALRKLRAIEKILNGETST